MRSQSAVEHDGLNEIATNDKMVTWYCSMKKLFLKISQNLQENNCAETQYQAIAYAYSYARSPKLDHLVKKDIIFV